MIYKVSPATDSQDSSAQQYRTDFSRSCAFPNLQRPIAECNAGMCGDVNLYMNDPEDAHCAEIEASTFPHSPGISVGNEGSQNSCIG